MSAISVSGLRMHYGGVEAVRGVDLTIEEGEVFALLGPNGAGKTTIVEILEGYRRRTAGDVDVLGFDPERNERDFKERIGIVLQESSVERELTVAETIETYGRYYPERLETGELIDIVGLGEKADARVKTLSGGQKRRLEVALGIVGNPDLVFLDEPTTGFDPAARRQAWGMIRNLRQLGKTILLTTHYMDEAQNLADRHRPRQDRRRGDSGHHRRASLGWDDDSVRCPGAPRRRHPAQPRRSGRRHRRGIDRRPNS